MTDAPGLPVAAAEELHFSVDGLTVAAKAWGPVDGLPILAVHGWLDNAASFDALAPLLPEARLVAIDLPGHGLSDPKSGHSTYHMVDWLPDVAAVLDDLGWERPVLMGHSMGAAVVAMLAGAQPERVGRLVLLEGLGPMTSSAEQMPERVGRYLAERSRQRSKPSKVPVYASAEDVAQTLCRALGSLTEPAARRLVGRGVRPLPGGGVTWRSDRRLRGTSPMRLTEEQAQAFLRRIRAPTLVVRALEGLSFDAAQVASRCACVADLAVVEVPGGHHVHLDAPEAVAVALRRFLGLKPATPTGADLG